MFRACRHLCSSMKYREQLAILQVAVNTTHLQTRSARTSRRQVTPRFETRSDVVDNQISHSLGLQHSLTIDYEYFKRIGNAVRKLDEAQLNGINMSVPFKNDTPAVVHSAESELLVEPYLQSYTPVLPEQSFNLAPYVNESETLSNLVKLGVDLSKIENDSMVANALVKMDFSREVKPLLLFLNRIGVTDRDIGKCITKCPGILRESLEDMQVRVNYLESKKFSLEAIAKVVSSQPMILMLATKDADAQLGYLQKDFKLNGKILFNYKLHNACIHFINENAYNTTCVGTNIHIGLIYSIECHPNKYMFLYSCHILKYFCGVYCYETNQCDT